MQRREGVSPARQPTEVLDLLGSAAVREQASAPAADDVIDGIIDAVVYQDVLKRGLLPLAAKIGGAWAFQHDNARPHSAKSIAAWFATHPTLPMLMAWPANSCDASPIENLWAQLQQYVDKCNATTMVELKRAIKDGWRDLTSNKATMEALLGGWRKRVHELVEREGGMLKIDY